MTELTRIDKQDLAAPVPQPLVLSDAVRLIPCQKPQADGDLGRIEKLSWQCDYAVDHIARDHPSPYLALAALGRRHRPVGEDDAGDAGRREVVENMLKPGEIGIAGRRGAVLPA